MSVSEINYPASISDQTYFPNVPSIKIPLADVIKFPGSESMMCL